MWLSLVERLVWDQDAAGSNPVIRTIWLGRDFSTKMLPSLVVAASKFYFYPTIFCRWASKGFRHGFERIKPRRYATA